MTAGGRFYPSASPEGTQDLSAEAALAVAADAVGATPNEPGPSLGIRAAAVIEDPSQKVSLPNIYAVPSLVDPSPMTAELVSFPMPAGGAGAARVEDGHRDRRHGWYEIVVDAVSGACLAARTSTTTRPRAPSSTARAPTCARRASFPSQQRLGDRDHDVGQQRQRVPGSEQLERGRVPARPRPRARIPRASTSTTRSPTRTRPAPSTTTSRPTVTRS